MQRNFPRREPRVLAIARTEQGIAWVTIDLFEIRSSGTSPARGRAVRQAIERLLLRERPSAITTGDKHVQMLVRRLTKTRLPIVEPPRRTIPFSILSELYAEAPLFAPTPRLERLARHAATILSRPLPSRRYEAPRS